MNLARKDEEPVCQMVVGTMTYKTTVCKKQVCSSERAFQNTELETCREKLERDSQNSEWKVRTCKLQIGTK